MQCQSGALGRNVGRSRREMESYLDEEFRIGLF
jgi:hypothetical protein